MNDAWEFRDELRRALRSALTSRQPDTVSALRTIIAAIDNAEAVPLDDVAPQSTSALVAHASVGVGSAEAPRRELHMADVREIVRDLVSELDSQAEHYRVLDQRQAAERLERQADLVRTYLQPRQ